MVCGSDTLVGFPGATRATLLHRALSWIVEKGISIEIKKGHTKHWRGLDAQKPHGKAIFGSGFLVSDKAAADKAAADKAAADGGGLIEWQLSRRELDVIKSLG